MGDALMRPGRVVRQANHSDTSTQGAAAHRHRTARRRTSPPQPERKKQFNGSDRISGTYRQIQVEGVGDCLISFTPLMALCHGPIYTVIVYTANSNCRSMQLPGTSINQAFHMRITSKNPHPTSSSHGTLINDYHGCAIGQTVLRQPDHSGPWRHIPEGGRTRVRDLRVQRFTVSTAEREGTGTGGIETSNRKRTWTGGICRESAE